MMKLFTTTALVILFGFATVPAGHAEEAPDAADSATEDSGTVSPPRVMYVDDVIWISLREGDGPDTPSKAVMPSGTRLTILERDEESGYSRVRRDDNGDTGWVLERYLSAEPIAEQQLAALQKRLERVTAERDELKQNSGSLRQETRDQQQENKSLAEENRRLRQELEEIKQLSQEELELRDSNQQLKEKLGTQFTAMNAVKAENETLSSRLYSFTIGAAVISLLIGLYIGTIPIRREKRWRSLP